jgi:hypothetical protein
MSNGNLTRFLGGSPGAVLVKLLLVSLLVGIILVWLDLTPIGLYRGIGNLIRSVIANGFDGMREIGRYVVTGAMIVIPIWVLLRLLDARKR